MLWGERRGTGFVTPKPDSSPRGTPVCPRLATGPTRPGPKPRWAGSCRGGCWWWNLVCGGSSWAEIIGGTAGGAGHRVRNLFGAAPRSMSPALEPPRPSAKSAGIRGRKQPERGRPTATGSGERVREGEPRPPRQGAAAQETAAKEPSVGPGRFNHSFSIDPGAPELSRSPGLTHRAPDPGVLPGAGPSAPPRWAAFGGPRSSPTSAPEVPAMGAPIGCATRRSGRPRPRGLRGTNPARAGAAPPLDSRGFVLGLRPRSQWGGRERAAGAGGGGGGGNTARAGPAAAETDVPPRGAAASGPRA